jgi:hypothetical protein
MCRKISAQIPFLYFNFENIYFNTFNDFFKEKCQQQTAHPVHARSEASI